MEYLFIVMPVLLIGFTLLAYLMIRMAVKSFKDKKYMLFGLISWLLFFATLLINSIFLFFILQ